MDSSDRPCCLAFSLDELLHAGRVILQDVEARPATRCASPARCVVFALRVLIDFSSARTAADQPSDCWRFRSLPFAGQCVVCDERRGSADRRADAGPQPHTHVSAPLLQCHCGPQPPSVDSPWVGEQAQERRTCYLISGIQQLTTKAPLRL